MATRAEIITAVCRGDKDAEKFCLALVEWLHWIDDTVDKDKPLTAEESVRINLQILIELSDNSFFHAHRVPLTTLLIHSFRDWADSVQWADRIDVRDRRAADVFKSSYHSIFWHIAYLVGGWSHLSEMTEKFRHVDHDCPD